MEVVENRSTYETADEAYKHYKEQFGDSPLASSLTPDQMQESFRVKLKDPEKYQVIATAFAGRDGRAVGPGPDGHPATTSSGC